MGKTWVGLTAVILLVLAARLYFAFQTPFYTTDEAYLHVRYTESLLQGKLLWHDPLGYGGRTLVMSPLFDGLLALFALILPLPLVLKIIPNIFASLLAIPVFLIAYSLTKHKPISLFTALLASFVPAFFTNTFNHLTPLTLAVPIFFFLAYAWLKIPKRAWIFTFLALLLVFVFLHPLSILFVLCIGVYIALISIEKAKAHQAEYELGLFSIFFALWAQFILYKKLILFHGPRVIWRNMPKELLSAFYSNTTIIGAMWQIGMFSLIVGTFALYKTAFKTPKKETQMLLSITMMVALGIWLKFTDLTTGLILLGITLTILFGQWLMMAIDFMRQTKIAAYRWGLSAACVILALATIMYPAYAGTQEQLRNTITQEEVSALISLSRATSDRATIIAPPDYGHYITAIMQRRNIIDSHFFLQKGINEIYQDVSRAYKTHFETEAVELFDKYSATHLIIPPGVKDITYAGKCFKRVQSTNIIIYEKNPACKVRVVA